MTHLISLLLTWNKLKILSKEFGLLLLNIYFKLEINQCLLQFLRSSILFLKRNLHETVYKWCSNNNRITTITTELIQIWHYIILVLKFPFLYIQLSFDQLKIVHHNSVGVQLNNNLAKVMGLGF